MSGEEKNVAILTSLFTNESMMMKKVERVRKKMKTEREREEEEGTRILGERISNSVQMVFFVYPSKVIAQKRESRQERKRDMKREIRCFKSLK